MMTATKRGRIKERRSLRRGKACILYLHLKTYLCRCIGHHAYNTAQHDWLAIICNCKNGCRAGYDGGDASGIPQPYLQQEISLSLDGLYRWSPQFL